MKQKGITLLLVLLCLLFSLTACGKPKAGKSFSMPILDEPVSLDPQIAHSNAEKLVATNCFEGLVTIGKDGQILPGVAKEYSVSEDGCTYHFTLREDTNWCVFSKHSALLKEKYGKEFKDHFPKHVTADDFVFAMERVKDPQTGSEDAYLFSAVSAIQALGEYNLEIKLAYPDENFLYALTTPGAMPCNRAFFELTGGRYGLETGYTLCNGPFHLATWNEKASLKLSKNEEYRGERAVKPASVVLYYNKDKNQIAEKMANGVYDVAFLTESEWQKIPHQKEYQAEKIADTTVSLLFHQTSGALANENMRLALCKAINLDGMELKENSQKANALVPPFCKIGANFFHGAETAKGMLAYHEKEAVKFFNEALLELGKTSVETEILCTAEEETFVREILQQWQKVLGVKFVANVVVLPANELETSVLDGQYEIALFPIRSFSSFTPDFLEQFGKGNPMGFESEAYQALLDKMHRNNANFNLLQAAAQEAESYLLSHAIVLPIQFENNYFLKGRDTDGIYFNSSRDYVYFIEAGKK